MGRTFRKNYPVGIHEVEIDHTLTARNRQFHSSETHMFRENLMPRKCSLPYGMICSMVIGIHVLLAVAPDAWADPKVIDRIAAVVNDEPISLFDLNQAMRPYLERLPSLGYSPEQEEAARYKLREDILNQLIDRKLTDQEIKRLNITVSEKEIDNTIERIKSQSFQTEEDLVEALKSQGLTLEEYRGLMKEQILRSKLVNIEVKSKIVVTKEDIAEYYGTHSDGEGFDKKYHIRNILLTLPPLADETEKDVVKEKMKSIERQFHAGKPFADLARQYSESPTAAEGGYLGEFDFKDLNQVLQAALTATTVGGITDILVTGQGYQLFYVEKITDSQESSLQEVTPEIEEKVYNEIVNKKFQSWLLDLRNKSVIKINR